METTVGIAVGTAVGVPMGVATEVQATNSTTTVIMIMYRAFSTRKVSNSCLIESVHQTAVRKSSP